MPNQSSIHWNKRVNIRPRREEASKPQRFLSFSTGCILIHPAECLSPAFRNCSILGFRDRGAGIEIAYSRNGRHYCNILSTFFAGADSSLKPVTCSLLALASQREMSLYGIPPRRFPPTSPPFRSDGRRKAGKKKREMNAFTRRETGTRYGAEGLIYRVSFVTRRHRVICKIFVAWENVSDRSCTTSRGTCSNQFYVILLSIKVWRSSIF